MNLSPSASSARASWWPLIVICLGTFMLLVDVSIVNVALPAMSIDLHAPLASLEWVIDAYALALAALLLLTGSLSDVLGRKRTYLIGVTVFTLASLICGLSPSEQVLIGARAAQGIGGAAMFATTIASLSRAYDGAQRGTAFGIWGATSGAAAAAGPILGGVLTQGLSWRWVFFVNLPIGVITLLIALRTLEPDPVSQDRRIDWGGGLAFTVSAATLTFAFVHVGAAGWGSCEALVLFTIAVAALVVFVRHELRTPSPLMDLRLLRPQFSAVLIAAGLYTAAAFATLVYTSLWLQTVLDLSPIAAGLVTLPMMILAFGVSALGGRFLHALPRRVVIAGGLLLIALGDLIETHLGARSGWADLITGFVIIGVGVGALAPVVASAATAAVPAERAGMASGAVNTTRQLGMAVGIAVFGTVFTSRVVSVMTGAGHSAQLARGVASGDARSIVLSASPSAHASLNGTVHAAMSSALGEVFMLAGLVAFAAAVFSVVLIGRGGSRGSEITADSGPGRRSASDLVPEDNRVMSEETRLAHA